ncbi:endoribonuclease L-PSP [Uncinocarpus reesii 1704]|uniref:Endoribonuclease L-PSP n=1 Tax=Uncinocarpus reesii (strain UAMH 1704) TaxID=336963 RepID=C4JI92_UNCRE|nr:endoribonuclease L-PSP [Uncinocarpus reesii 1704]EEP77989.1 endoribonuclease L-PSP [Uncinocarpus reesii 1704]
MTEKRAVFTEKGAAPLPVFSQAVVHNGMIYCSGSIGLDPATKKVVEGGIGERTVQALRNLSVVLEAGGSSIQNVVKVNVFLTSMKDFAEMNEAYEPFFSGGVKPVWIILEFKIRISVKLMPILLKCRTCVAVKELPFGTDVEIECIAFLTV